jgi:undecaprenyl-diphosphatase
MLILDKKNQYLLGTEILITVLSNQLIKNIIARVRPDHIRLIEQGGYSFPSGHAMISIALYGFIIYLLMTKSYNKYIKIIGIPLLVLLIIGIGCSRIYVGVHYPSDILAGYLLSMTILLLTITLCNHFGGIENDKDGCK